MSLASALLACLAAFVAGAFAGPLFRRVGRRLGKLRSEPAVTAPLDLLQYARRTGYFAEFPTRGGIVCIGDSRIEHADWNEVLERSGVLNRGVSGDTSEGVLKRLDVSVARGVQLCIIQAGVNDLWRGVPIATVQQHYRQIVRHMAVELGAEVIVTSVVVVDQRRMELNASIAELNSLIREDCKQSGVHWFDLNDTLAPAGYLEPRFTDDGTHFTGAAYKAMAAPLRAAIERVLNGQRP